MSAASIPGLTLAGEPRVQLLPPSVKGREKSRSARRMMGLIVVLAVVVAGAGTGFAFLLMAQAESRLAEAQARTLDILAQQSEYSEGAEVAAQVTATEDARRVVTGSEIDWLQLTEDVLSYIPCDCTAADVAFTAPAPWEPTLIPEGPLRPARVATMTLHLESPSYANAADFLFAVRDMEGVADVVITTSTRDGDVYDTEVVLTFDPTVFALRYGPGAETAERVGTGVAPIDPGATPAPSATEGAAP